MMAVKVQYMILAYGLIELLVENNFTLKSLLNTSSSELSKTLGIDQQVATLFVRQQNTEKRPLNKEFGESM
jgi:hypothetical protein